MNDYVRAGIIILVIILIFGFSYVSTKHLAEVRVIADAEAVVTLQAENDSLRTVITNLSDSTEVANE